MKINRVGYGETIPDGNYGNIKVHFEADLEDWETPEDCINELRKRCKQITHVRNELADLKNLKRNLNSDIVTLEGRLKAAADTWGSAKAEWKKLEAFAIQQGFEIKARFPSDPYFYKTDAPKDSFFEDDEDEDDEDVS